MFRKDDRVDDLREVLKTGQSKKAHREGKRLLDEKRMAPFYRERKITLQDATRRESTSGICKKLSTKVALRVKYGILYDREVIDRNKNEIYWEDNEEKRTYYTELEPDELQGSLKTSDSTVLTCWCFNEVEGIPPWNLFYRVRSGIII